ncbi:MAG: DUF3313 domain-containing protein [Elusimicrobia bacterium]|nr:DUF3313 domain-containing protein [Elusimicrobiota bacterium]
MTSPISPAAILLLLCPGLLAGGCAFRPKPGTYTGVPEAEQLRQDQRYPHSLVYIKEMADRSVYTKVKLDPVAIYQGQDAQWRGVSAEVRQQLAQYAQEEFSRVLRQSYELVDRPGPGVLGLKITLADAELTQPILAVPLHLVPAGIALNLARTAAGLKGSFMGSATISGELRDTASGEVLAAFLTRQTPLAIDPTATATRTAAARRAIAMTAENLRSAMNDARAGRGRP